MDAFSYLSVLLSVILGLAIQQVLMGYRSLMLSRRTVTFYAPPLVWSVLILLMVAQHWWVSFSLAGRSDWTFAMFATILVETALIYMMAALVLPDVPASEPTDLRAHYYRERPAFFGVGLAVIGWSVARDLILNRELPQGANFGFHLVFMVFALTGVISRWPRVHEVLAVLMVLLFTVYIALLFARL